MLVAAAGPTIEALIRESGLPRRDAEVLLQAALGCERVRLVAHAEERVESSKARAAQASFARRRGGEPLSYITGLREFFGLALRVGPDVLIPRAETEQLVDLALERLPPGSTARVLDLGTGSGAIAIALARSRPGLKITASDASEAALRIARANALAHAAKIELVRSDWFESIGPGLFDLIVSNPPYVAAADPHLEAGDLRHEPRLALVGGDDGLACLRVIAGGARRQLRRGGALLLEHGYDQGKSCPALLQELGFTEIADHCDLAGLPRVTTCVWRG